MPEHVKVAGFDRFTVVELTRTLERAGFTVESTRGEGSNMGKFFARRS